MIRSALLGVVFGTLVAALVLPVAAKDREDDPKDVPGTIWHYELTHGSRKQGGQFRVQGTAIFNGDKRVGTIRPKSDDETTLIFSGHRDFDGKAALRRVERRPPVWEGTLKKDDGTEWQMKVTIKDR